MKTYAYMLPALVCAIILLALSPVLAQEGTGDAIFEVAYVEANTAGKTIDLYVKAYDASGLPLLTNDRSGLSALMLQGRKAADPLNVLSISPLSSESGSAENTSSKQASLHVLFLLDLSGSMRGEKLDKAKQAISNVLERDMLRGSNSTVEFAWFHDDISENKTLSKYNFVAVVDPVDVGPERKGKDTDLYRAIRDKTNALIRSPAEQKVIILLTDGKNDIERNSNYRGTNPLQPISRSEILSHVSQLDSSLQIFSVGVGGDADESFLLDLTNSTRNPNDSYSYNVAPADLARKFVQIAGKISGPNFKISLFPNPEDAVFGPEERIFKLEYQHSSSNNQSYAAEKTVVLGSATNYVDLRPGTRQQDRNYISALVTGIALLFLLLAVLSFLAPIYNEKQFKAKYVRKYRDVKRAGVSNKVEAFTHEPFHDDEDVVVNAKGDKMLKLATWKYLRSENQEHATGDHAELFTLEAKSGDFFSQRGVFKKLNWLWFGALGGVLAWALNALLGLIDWGWYKDMLTVFDDPAKQISPSIFRETLTGIAMGAGIVGALAVAEERGSFRGFNIGSILLRILIGIIAGYLFFFIESVLIAKYIPYDFWGHLVAWTLFGTAMGVVVTLLSSIEIMNGLKGGVLAGLAAFLLYYLLNLPVMNELFPGEVARVISFFCYGGLLGIILFTVIKSLEAYELLCLSPKPFAGWQSPISKWLKSPGIDFISIGTNPKNRVYIKWEDDEVRPRHARLRLIRETPYIEPDEGPVWVNRTPIHSAIALNDGDSIQLSNYSILQFVAKEQKVSADYSGGRPAIKVKRRSPKEVQAVRRKIKINRKP